MRNQAVPGSGGLSWTRRTPKSSKNVIHGDPISLFFTSGRRFRFHHAGGLWDTAHQSRLLRPLSFDPRTLPQLPPQSGRSWGNKASVDLALPLVYARYSFQLYQLCRNFGTGPPSTTKVSDSPPPPVQTPTHSLADVSANRPSLDVTTAPSLTPSVIILVVPRRFLLVNYRLPRRRLGSVSTPSAPSCRLPIARGFRWLRCKSTPRPRTLFFAPQDLLQSWSIIHVCHRRERVSLLIP